MSDLEEDLIELSGDELESLADLKESIEIDNYEQEKNYE